MSAALKRGARWCGYALLAGLVWPCRGEQVVVSRIQFEPRAGQPEYIELYNNTSNPFEIARWKLTGGVTFDFPDFSADEPKAIFLRPFERVVVSAAEPSITRTAYSIPESVRVFGPWTGKLRHKKERITLQDKNRVVICSLKYDNGGLLSGHQPSCPVILHTSNHERRWSMHNEFRFGGWRVEVVPPIGDDWIRRSWLSRAKALIGL